MSLPRFHIPADRWNPEDLALDSAEAHHCIDVLRCKPGERVITFNGAGVEATAEITAIEEQTVLLRGISVSRSEPLGAKITLAQAVPKGKNMDFIVQKATELGASEIAPLLSERTVVRLGEPERRRKQEKWHRVALEASKQCGQNWLPVVQPPRTAVEFLDGTHQKPPPGNALPPLLLIASLQPDSLRFKEVLREYRELNDGRSPDTAVVLIGPEGDFTPAEIALARSAGYLPFTLGPIVLRSETAALYSLSVLAHELF